MIVFNKREITILKSKLRKYYPKMNAQSIEDCIQDSQLSLIKYNTELPKDLRQPLVYYWPVVLQQARQARCIHMKKRTLFREYKIRESSVETPIESQFDQLLKKEGRGVLIAQLKDKVRAPKETAIINEVLRVNDVKEAADNLNMNRRIAFQTITNIVKKLDIIK